MTDSETMERNAREAELRGFEKWMAEPMTRVLLSTIPEGENRDALSALLQSAYKAGFNLGQGNMAGEFLKSFISRETRRMP